MVINKDVCVGVFNMLAICLVITAIKLLINFWCVLKFYYFSCNNKFLLINIVNNLEFKLN